MADNLSSPIIVTGCARSGTSLVAGVLHYCGAWIGTCTGPTRWNKKGQFENEYIRDQLTKPFLRSLGFDPMGQDPLPGKLDPNQLDHKWSSKVLYAMLNQGYDKVSPWMFKGAKACLIWQQWHMAFPKARWLIVRRDDEGIIDSCMRTSFMRKRSTRESWQEWIDIHKRKFHEMVLAGLDVRSFWVDPALELLPNLEPFKMLCDVLELQWDKEKVGKFVDPQLWDGGGRRK